MFGMSVCEVSVTFAILQQGNNGSAFDLQSWQSMLNKQQPTVGFCQWHFFQSAHDASQQCTREGVWHWPLGSHFPSPSLTPSNFPQLQFQTFTKGPRNSYLFSIALHLSKSQHHRVWDGTDAWYGRHQCCPTCNRRTPHNVSKAAPASRSFATSFHINSIYC